MIHSLLTEAGITNGIVIYDGVTGEPSLADGHPIAPAILADWRAKHAERRQQDNADRDAEDYAEQLDRRARYDRAMADTTIPPRHRAALIRLRGLADAEITRLRA